MKILYHHRIAARDGMDVHKTELIKAFRSLGHEVIEVGPAAQQRSNFGDDGGVVDTIRNLLPRFASEVLEIVYDRFAYFRLKKIYLQERPDILYERHNLFLSAGKRLKEKFGVPFYLEVNAPLAEERSQNGGLSLSRFAHTQEGAVWRAADRIFPVTKVLARYLIAKGVNETHIEVMPNAVDPKVFYPEIDDTPVRKRYGLEDTIVLGFTGFIRDWHGLDQVIALLPELNEKRNIHLLIVGDGPARAALEQQATSTGFASHIHFTGVISREEIPNYIAAFDIALQPAVTAYASPLKIFEYLGMGKLVLAPDAENIKEVIVDGQNGVLFPTDPQDTADAFKRALLTILEGGKYQDLTFSCRAWSDNAAQIIAPVEKLSHD